MARQLQSSESITKGDNVQASQRVVKTMRTKFNPNKEQTQGKLRHNEDFDNFDPLELKKIRDSRDAMVDDDTEIEYNDDTY